jgi:hypothetical protein
MDIPEGIHSGFEVLVLYGVVSVARYENRARQTLGELSDLLLRHLAKAFSGRLYGAVKALGDACHDVEVSGDLHSIMPCTDLLRSRRA